MSVAVLSGVGAPARPAQPNPGSKGAGTTSGTASGSVAPLVALTRPDMERVNALIIDHAGSDVALIPEIARHLVDSGGKRLRPMLTCASAGMHGYGRDGDAHVRLACAVEFMHTATLLHDDVVDESDMRRKRPTARTIWGNQASVLVGDFLLGQAFRMMVSVGSMDALDVLSSASAVIAEGEVHQLSAAKRMVTSEAEYLRIIRAKTAALFAAACETGAIVAGASDDARAAMRTYGDSLGIAFQLIDDALDYGGSSEALGKNTGDDFREGKITLPVILAHQAGGERERAFWREAIEAGRNGDAELAEARALMDRHGTIAATVERARSYGETARGALDAAPRGPWRDALAEVVDYCVSRAS